MDTNTDDIYAHKTKKKFSFNHFVIEFAEIVAAFDRVIVVGSVRFRFQSSHRRGSQALGSPQFAHRPDGHRYCAGRSAVYTIRGLTREFII